MVNLGSGAHFDTKARSTAISFTKWISPTHNSPSYARTPLTTEMTAVYQPYLRDSDWIDIRWLQAQGLSRNR
jgi:hypothetical protein